MAGMMVSLRWDGAPLSAAELAAKAQAAVSKVGAAFEHVDQLDIKAVPVEDGQYVQLAIDTSATEEDCQRMTKMLKEEFEDTGESGSPAPKAAADPAIEQQVKDIICEKLSVKPEQVTPETSFINDLGADSLDTVELVMELEDRFGIQIPDEEAEKIQTVGDAIRYIEEHKA